jgi:hypothetical protein
MLAGDIGHPQDVFDQGRKDPHLQRIRGVWIEVYRGKAGLDGQSCESLRRDAMDGVLDIPQGVADFLNVVIVQTIRPRIDAQRAHIDFIVLSIEPEEFSIQFSVCQCRRSWDRRDDSSGNGPGCGN